MTLDITVTDLFCGAGGSSTGATRAGARVQLAINHWPVAIETHNTNYPETAHVLTDISRADPRRYPSTTMLLASPECFPAGTLILTARGLVPIEQVHKGDQVFTHKNRWKPVTATTQTVKDTITIQGDGHYGLETTPEHPFLARQGEWKNKHYRILSDATWVPASDLSRGMFWASPILSETDSLPIPEVGGRGAVFCKEFWWMIGKWLADGVVTEKAGGKRHIRISCSFAEVDETYERMNCNPPSQSQAIKGEYQWSREKREHQVFLVTSHNGLGLWLTKHFGKLAHGKTLPSWAFTMPEEWRKSLLDGYLFGDGTYNSTRGGYTFTTVSKSLAIGIRLLAISLGYPCWLSKRKGGYEETINGISFARREQYLGSFIEEPKLENAVVDGTNLWFRIGSMQPGQSSQTVFNLSVEDDESSMADGFIVHHCTNHSLAKGQARKRQQQLPLFGERGYDPSAERSRATMWDPLRWAECHQYELVILENVVDARLWVMWEAWLHAWQTLGYAFEIVYLNSMFAHPTPQSRDRLYFVAWKRGNCKPDLRIEPMAFCPKCFHDVESVQSWKNPVKRYGKYRQQYVYCCPSCATEVTPYYYAAANAIDWSRPLERIGDRKKPLKEKTLRRIASGLEKFECSAFPRQTAGNGAALVSPFLLSLNHPKTRITNVETQAFATQTAYDDTALVTPPQLVSVSHASQGEGRIIQAPERALPRHRGRSDMAMVLPWQPASRPGGPPPFLLDHIGEYRPRSLTRPISTVVGEGNHQSLVVPSAWLMTYYQNGRLAPVEEATPTVTTVERHALVTSSTQHTTEDICVEECGFRMLAWEEIRAAMAFPADYQITGNRREKVKQLGNAVTPPAMEILVRRAIASL